MGIVKKENLARPQIQVELAEPARTKDSAIRYYHAKLAQFQAAITDDVDTKGKDMETAIKDNCPWIFDKRAKNAKTGKMAPTGKLFVCVRLHQMPVFLDMEDVGSTSEIKIYDADGSSVEKTTERKDMLGMSDYAVDSYEAGWQFLNDFGADDNAEEFEMIMARAAEGKREQDEEERPNMKRRIGYRYEQEVAKLGKSEWGDIDHKDNGTGRSKEKQKAITAITNSVRNETGYGRYYEKTNGEAANLG